MKRAFALTLGLLLIAPVVHAAAPQPGLTGDRTMDAILRGMNTEAKADPEGLISQISTLFGFPAQDIRQARDTYTLDPAGVYMAAALAHATHRPVLVVAENYKQNQGQGWGVLAQSMGIKPGSAAFHELKRSGQGCLNHMRADTRKRQQHEKQMKQEQQRKMKSESKAKGGGQPH